MNPQQLGDGCVLFQSQRLRKVAQRRARFCRSAGWVQLPGDQLEQRRFAAPVGADQPRPDGNVPSRLARARSPEGQAKLRLFRVIGGVKDMQVPPAIAKGLPAWGIAELAQPRRGAGKEKDTEAGSRNEQDAPVGIGAGSLAGSVGIHANECSRGELGC